MKIKIITDGFPKDDEVLIDEISMTYVQNPDCTEDRDDDWQKFILTTRDNGVAKFLNLKAENWSFDDTEDIVAVIEDFKKRIGYDKTEKED